MFKKIYLEISNICNVQCSFCPIVEREKEILSPAQFEKILIKVKDQTEELSLHLMGEPTAHPELDKILLIAGEYDVKINLTTNGILTKRKSELLLNSKAIRQINFSLQAYQDNFPEKPILNYLNPILEFSKVFMEKNPDKYINYRLWNLGDDNLNNSEVLEVVESFFDIDINRNVDVAFKKSKRIWKNIYLHFDSRFEWPSLDAPFYSKQGKCYGLSSHIGIHANGTVVPCCLDKEATINLGNINDQSLDEILNSDLAVSMKKGFQNGVLYHEMCQRCDFVNRFKK